MPDLPIRSARREDLPAIVALLADDAIGAARECPAEPLDPCYVAAFEAIEADSRNELFVLEEEGRLLGCFQLTYLPCLSAQGTERAQIESVRIASSARGRGLGERMLRWAMQRAQARGCTAMQLASDKRRTDARRFYERLGFTASHEGMKRPLG
ncbi:GNAT family N-acetyltransferase [Marinimicrococcus flavescens]|uniref:GNAT family N-acetyltransferase n=1 Tax=Marinimicrococcus flavescens TaxID=3031815 RepID=A0AAP3UYX7_9PROT|nr:GNAT family N-acetyltransferase [Marinimicrococcus flavescens]